MRGSRRADIVVDSPRVSVVIPCYNYGRFLPDAVESVLAQEGVDLDVTILDDASTDDSADIAAAVAERDARVQVIRHAQNRGHVETSNEALALATGEFVVKLDADDLLTKGSLARSVALMRANPDVAFCYGYAEQFHDTPPMNVPTRIRSWTVWQGARWAERVIRGGHNPICQPEVVMRQDAVAASGGYRPELRWAEDLNLWLRLSMMGSVGRVNGPTQGLYRMHPHSFTRSAAQPQLTDLRARVTAIDRFIAECGTDLENPELTRRAALVALARNARIVAARVGEGDPTHAEYMRIADELESRSGGRRASPIVTSQTTFGRGYREIEARVRWRRWRRYGI